VAEPDALAALDGYLDECTQRVDAALEAWLPDRERGAALAEAMRHIALSGGKRLRPALVLLGCSDVGGDEARALGAAVALELVHAYSLVHDDLPCMDDASLRRGRPCVHTVWGEAMGVLAGDALLTLAFEVLGRATPADAPVGTMVAVLARGAGWEGMVGGQVADLDGEGSAPDLERVRAIHLGKTAALMSAALQLGALAGGGTSADVERLGSVGRDLGLAFQIVDDLLDTEQVAAVLGKDAGADVAAGKLTWPAVVGPVQARLDARRLVDQATEAARRGRQARLLAALGSRLLTRRH